ncbi:hypothetical protein GLE_2595 [Lysobacter enzymogenes]|uniref:Uncharacterized protein n=1 Tax=Lysobacter enzymogenes TaxID=69 RepID=A0A0S2DH18_LYSEN|nr:hypothetical protein GLE_2595 [Lysobacter enzymogenes]
MSWKRERRSARVGCSVSMRLLPMREHSTERFSHFSTGISSRFGSL